MTEPAPPIDTRTAAQIETHIKRLLREYYLRGYGGPAWNETNDRLGTTLIKIFARFAEIIIERLNQAPEKNFIAFLDLLGASRLPPQPACAQLTFALADGATGDTLVPAGTQVSGTAAGGGPPVVFETEHDLVVTSARLAALFVRDPATDRYADWSAILADGASQGELVFRGKDPIEHAFYVGHKTLVGLAAIVEVKLDFELSQVWAIDAPPLQWEVWDGKAGIKLEATDNTANLTQLTQSGQVTLRSSGPIPNLIFPELILCSTTSRWLRCRVIRDGKTGLQLPTIKDLKLTVTSSSTGLSVEAASANTMPLDLGKELFPFGEKPRLGDCFYLAQHEAFSQAGAKVTLRFTVTDPETYIATIPESHSTPTLKWEFWNGKAWTDLKVPENIEAFTNKGVKQVTFTVPAEIRPTLINGVENCWIRVRISFGDYGKDAGINIKTDDKGQPKKDDGQIIYTIQPSTLVPPQLSALSVDYTLTSEAQLAEAIVTYNDFACDHIEIQTSTAKPLFQPMRDATPTLYLGFILPEGREVFPDRPLTLYFLIAETEYRTELVHSSSADSPSVAWEYWKANGADNRQQSWAPLAVEDGTEALTRSGTVVWLPPADIAVRADFGLDQQYWLRIRVEKGDYPYPPRLRRLLLNTTQATQTYTIAEEILGSSDGSRGQRFRAGHAPVLFGQRLEVLEPDLPTALECAAIRNDEGEDAIQMPEGATPPQGIWVRWHEVPDFYASEPRDRHYVLDHLTGEVRFGDGLNSLIPPRGVGNVRLTRYQTGGGVHGNLPAGAIAQLATTLPLHGVVNWEPAAGGADAESLEALRERAPRLLRHGDRAVSRDDYEDLAVQASPEVVRAHCVPLWDRSSVTVFNPPETQPKGGHVTVMLLPHSDSPKPLPSIELVRRVQAYLDDRRLPDVTLHVAGPDYLCVTVKAEVVAVSLEAASRLDVKEVLVRFLHPLTGGVDGRGWPWGHLPQASNLYRCIEAIPGVDHVQMLKVEGEPEDRRKTDLSETSYFLVYSGEHDVTVLPPK